jgi:predicted esterase YcpF (UPF0227 family)
MAEAIIYIHGFASCGSGNKVAVLRNYFGEDRLLAPDLPLSPNQAVQLLSASIEQQSIALLIGSSLGGFYAEYLGRLHDLPCVLINPATRPFDTLSKCVGINTNWCSGEEFEWRAEYNTELSHMYREQAAPDQRYLVLLQTGDEVLDYRLAVKRYRQHKVITQKGGNHRFENLVEYLSVIDDFLKPKKSSL